MTARLGLILVLSMGLISSAFAQREVIPFASPDDVRFGDSRFSLPDPASHRVDLGEGLVAFVVADPNVATVELTAIIGASRLDDPEGKTGLAEAVAHAIRRGPRTWTEVELSNRLYRMSAELRVSVDNEQTRVSLSFLEEDLDEGLELFAAMLRQPRIEDATLESFRQSATRPRWNPDDPRARPEFEFARLLYGDHPAGRRPTTTTLTALTLEDLKEFHTRFFAPNNIVLALSGGFDKTSTVSKLKEQLFETAWFTRAIEHQNLAALTKPKPRVIHTWDVDRLQGWAVVGHQGVVGREADRPALEIANYILGGGGAVWKRLHPELPPSPAEGHFDARLFNESRAKRGLTNDTSSYVPVGFRVATPTYALTLGRPESMAFLFKIIDDEWTRIGSEVSALDIEVAKGALTEGYFQMRYAGAHQTALSLAEELFFDGGHEWAQGYEEAIRSTTKAEVLAAARKYFRPEDLFAALVGPIDAMLTKEHPLYKAKLTDFGEIVRHEW